MTNHEPFWRDRTLILVLLAGLVLRLGLWAWFSQGQSLHDDERDYDQIARTLLEHGVYGFRPEERTSLRPPLYPAFLALAYGVFGHDHQTVRLIQITGSLATTLFVYLLATELYSRRTAVVSAAFHTCYPSLLGYANLVLTEILFTLLLIAGCYAFVRAVKGERLIWLVAASVLLGLATLTRSVLWMSPPLVIAYLLWSWQGSLMKRALAAVVAVIAFAAPIAPWAWRNTQLQGTFTAVDCMGGRNFMMGNYEHTPLFRSWATIEIQGERSWSHEVHKENPPPPGRHWTQGEVDKLALKQGLKFVFANPLLTMKRSLIKFFDFWGLERELVSGALSGYYGDLSKVTVGILALIVFGSYVLVLFSGIFGAIVTPPDDKRLHLFVLMIIAYVCLLHTLVFGHSRYHLPLMPLITIYSAAACVQAKQIWSARGNRPFLLAAGACVVLLGAWTIIFLCEDATRLQQLLQQ